MGSGGEPGKNLSDLQGPQLPLSATAAPRGQMSRPGKRLPGPVAVAEESLGCHRTGGSESNMCEAGWGVLGALQRVGPPAQSETLGRLGGLHGWAAGERCRGQSQGRGGEGQQAPGTASGTLLEAASRDPGAASVQGPKAQEALESRVKARLPGGG